MTKENSIKDVKTISGLIFLLLIYFSCNLQNKYINNNQVLYKIIFGDGFNNDKITLSVNDFVVFQNENLSSGKSDGVTNIWLSISQNAKCIFVDSSKDNDLRKVGLISDGLSLSILYKGKKVEFRLNSDEGRYLVFSDDGNGNLIFIQRKEKPVFE